MDLCPTNRAMDDPDTWSIPLENAFSGFEHRVPTDEDGEEIGKERSLHFDSPVLVFVWVQAELLEVFFCYMLQVSTVVGYPRVWWWQTMEMVSNHYRRWNMQLTRNPS